MCSSPLDFLFRIDGIDGGGFQTAVAYSNRGRAKALFSATLIMILLDKIQVSLCYIIALFVALFMC